MAAAANGSKNRIGRMARDRTKAGCCDRNTVYDRIEAVIGREVTLRLLDRLGGRLIYVRVAPDGGADDLISAAIGLEDSRRFSECFGGERLSLPVRHSPFRESRTRASRIRELAAARLAPAEIAVRVGCSQRWVNFVLNGK
jgi:hypothetical protein